ncbi:RNA polymerase I-specific transcription initiation factor RRN3 [Impatiens glandulifera]|uniref:RNA polymerase I-specific transcription initiation factor RRN3 n=1 Tax=Impatiens glandulifera TaxID=253017 RepID=UPI001FB09579|nr:RNA polymerase I-specific transcription initiation factor RRN3 [Impatiens glandulifera]
MQKFEIDKVEDVNLSDLELVCFVREALRSVIEGDRSSYEQLLGVLHRKGNLGPDEVALLVTSLKALTGAVSCIDIAHHDALLASIFGMNMWNYEPDVMDALIELITSLAASSGGYLDLCLGMLVNNFMPPRSFLEFLNQKRGLSRKGQVVYRVHSALKDISDLVPLAPLRLLPIILQKLPNTFAMEKAIVVYVENMLRVEECALGDIIGNMMLTALVDRLIEFDVEIEWKDIMSDDFSKGIFEMELEDVDDILDDAETEGFELSGGFPGRNILKGNKIAETLDSLLVLMFEHLKTCHESGRLVKVFETLLQSFQITVLSTYKSKFAQFVMFYACSLDPENCGVRFANELADIFSERSHPPNKTMSAVAYLASFLSRSNFLPLSFVVKMLQRLVNWCWIYCQDHKSEINPQAHRVFYACCQAVMYVLCFRMRSIMDDPKLRSKLTHFPLEEIFKHPLNPLKVCLPTIVDEFLRQARASCLFTASEARVFDDLLESEFSIAFGGLERLDTFFPFDPCLLKKSDSFIRPWFISWSMVKTTYEEEEEEDDQEEIMTADAMATSLMEEEEFSLDYSLNRMSITPKSTLNYHFGGAFNAVTKMPSRIRPSTSPESF